MSRRAHASRQAVGRPIRVSVSAEKLAWLGAVLALVGLLLALLHAGPHPAWGLKRWFCSMQFFVASAVAAYTASLDRRRQPISGVNGWWMLSALFLWLSIEQIMRTQPCAGDWLKLYYSIQLGSQEILVSWEMMLAPVVVTAAVYFGFFLWQRLRGRPLLQALSASGLLAWIGALIGYEWLGMTGVTCFLIALIRYATTRTFSDES
jgi:hypothetical protein